MYTILTRILRDESSLKQINKFFDDFIKTNPLKLVNHEIDLLREAINVNAIGVETYIANKKMLTFVNKVPEVPECICKKSFGELDISVRTLTDLFLTYKNLESLTLFVQNCMFSSATGSVKELLSMSDKFKIEVHQYVTFEQSPEQGLTGFINLLPVVNHPKYSCHISPFFRGGNGGFLNGFVNRIIVIKETKNGDKYCDLIYFMSETSFSILSNLNNDDVFDFYSDMFESMKEEHHPLKASFAYADDLERLFQFTKERLMDEENSEEICIKPDLCYKMLSPEIWIKLLEDANYFGLDKNNDKIKEFISIQMKRNEVFRTRHKPYIHIFNRQGLINFVKTGKFSDAIPCLRSFTQDEVKQILRNLIDICENNQNISFHMLENEINYNNFTYLLYENRNLLLSDNKATYDQCFHYSNIYIDYIISGFDFFVKNELLKRYTIGHKETIDFIKLILDNL